MMEPVLDYQLQQLFDTGTGCWGCKDLDSVFRYLNQASSDRVGFRDRFDAIGLTDDDLPCDAAACAALFRQQDAEVIRQGRPLRILDIHPYANGQWRAFVFTKTPWLDDTRQTVGTIFHGVELTSPMMIELGHLLSTIVLQQRDDQLVGETSYVIARDRGEVRLTPREAEILFLLLRFQAAKHIARALGISPRTVEQHLESLKHKFAAGSKSELFDRAMQLGYLNYLPETLFHRQLSVILREGDG